MKQNGLVRLLTVLEDLRHRNIPFRIERQMPEAIMVTFVVCGKCVEVDFFADEVWFSRFDRDPEDANDASVMSMIENDSR